MDYYFSSDVGSAIAANMMAFSETVRYLGRKDSSRFPSNSFAEELAIEADHISDTIIEASHEKGGKVSLSESQYLVMLSSVRQALDFYVEDFGLVELAISEASNEKLQAPTIDQKLNTIRKTTFLIEYLEVNAVPEVFNDWMNFKKSVISDAIEEGSARFCGRDDG